MSDPRWESALAALRNEPAIMRQVVELAATSVTSTEDAARACAHLMVALAERHAAIRRATAATLHTVAEWGEVSADELHDIAQQVAGDTVTGDVEDWTACPVCEEIECDAGCPLAPVRGAAS